MIFILNFALSFILVILCVNFTNAEDFIQTPDKIILWKDSTRLRNKIPFRSEVNERFNFYILSTVNKEGDNFVSSMSYGASRLVSIDNHQSDIGIVDFGHLHWPRDILKKDDVIPFASSLYRINNISSDKEEMSVTLEKASEFEISSKFWPGSNTTIMRGGEFSFHPMTLKKIDHSTKLKYRYGKISPRNVSLHIEDISIASNKKPFALISMKVSSDILRRWNHQEDSPHVPKKFQKGDVISVGIGDVRLRLDNISSKEASPFFELSILSSNRLDIKKALFLYMKKLN